MTVSVSAYLDISPVDLATKGAFDAILDVDSKLFIDPHLLKFTEAPELKHSHQRVRDHFAGIIKLLAKSTRIGDIYWRNAAKRFQFTEVQGLCIGYSSKSTSGSGMGRELQTRLLYTAKTIIDAGIQDPEMFELMGLFEKDIGADRISDMTARIILPDLFAYTERIFQELGVTNTHTITYGDDEYQMPANWHNRRPIILIPKDILRDLPVAYDLEDIERVVAFNEQLRNRLNKLVGGAWKDKRPTKADYKRVILSDPAILRELVDVYRDLPPTRYDFERDPSGQYIWYQRSWEYAEAHPLDLSLKPFPSADEVLAVVLDICQEFRQAIENNGLHTLLYRDTACLRPKYEEAAQKVFLGIANAYCKANNLDLSPETNSGRGAVDFKVSRGYKSRVLVETKLSSNRNLVHGFKKQLIEYQKAEETEHSVYIVIDVGGCSDDRWQEFHDTIHDARDTDKRVPEVIIVYGQKRPTASKI